MGFAVSFSFEPILAGRAAARAGLLALAVAWLRRRPI